MFARLRCLFLFLVLVAAACAHAAEFPKEEQLVTAQKVHDIFEAKCLDCHGPELARPKGKFGYVLDLQRMADNPEYVKRGKAEESELFKLVFNDEMPGEDANVPALTPGEKETVKHWIEMGAPGELPTTPSATPSPTPSESAKPKDPLWKAGLRWIGQFHPLSTHFPVALMFVAVFAEGLAWWTRRDQWFQTVRFLVIVSACSAVGATILGWVNAYFSSYNKAAGALLWWHRWLGTSAGVWALICAGLIIISQCAEGSPERKRFRGALLAGAVLVGVAGFLGSALIYGFDHYAWK
jgi:uncharacterized membrane protein